ncbi:unnamed protein product, partial [Amoebophrya sp. A25]
PVHLHDIESPKEESPNHEGCSPHTTTITMKAPPGAKCRVVVVPQSWSSSSPGRNHAILKNVAAKQEDATNKKAEVDNPPVPLPPSQRTVKIRLPDRRLWRQVCRSRATYQEDLEFDKIGIARHEYSESEDQESSSGAGATGINANDGHDGAGSDVGMPEDSNRQVGEGVKSDVEMKHHDNNKGRNSTTTTTRRRVILKKGPNGGKTLKEVNKELEQKEESHSGKNSSKRRG